MLATTLDRYSASPASDRRGLAGAITGKPARWSRSTTPFHPDESAQAPWTSTMVGFGVGVGAGVGHGDLLGRCGLLELAGGAADPGAEHVAQAHDADHRVALDHRQVPEAFGGHDGGGLVAVGVGVDGHRVLRHPVL